MDCEGLIQQVLFFLETTVMLRKIKRNGPYCTLVHPSAPRACYVEQVW
jgi:hypothetical protein